MPQAASPARRRGGPLLLPFALVVALAALWSGAWFFIAARVPDTIADWRAGEAKAGRVYDCGNQTIAGFPFRIEVRCAEPSADLSDLAPPLEIKAAQTLFVWQVYQPSLV